MECSIFDGWFNVGFWFCVLCELVFVNCEFIRKICSFFSNLVNLGMMWFILVNNEIGYFWFVNNVTKMWFLNLGFDILRIKAQFFLCYMMWAWYISGTGYLFSYRSYKLNDELLMPKFETYNRHRKGYFFCLHNNIWLFVLAWKY